MKIKIFKVQKNGDETKEYVTFQVTENCQIGHYLVCDNTYTSAGKLSNKVRHVYWFPNRTVNKGDVVYLYTGKGKNSKQEHDDGSTTHSFYWGLGTAVWNDASADAAVLMLLSDWTSKAA